MPSLCADRRWWCVQCKAVKANRMTFPEFRRALRQIAELLGVSQLDVIDRILASQGPLANNITLPKYVRAHDDRHNRTGVRTSRWRAAHHKHCSTVLC